MESRRVAVFPGELSDPSASDLKLFGDQGGVHIVITNPLTDPSDIVLVKFPAYLAARRVYNADEISGLYYTPVSNL